MNLEFLGNGVVLAAAILSVMGKDTLSPGIVGLAVSHSLQVRVITECLQSQPMRKLHMISWSCHSILLSYLLSAFAMFSLIWCLNSENPTILQKHHLIEHVFICGFIVMTTKPKALVQAYPDPRPPARI